MPGRTNKRPPSADAVQCPAKRQKRSAKSEISSTSAPDDANQPALPECRGSPLVWADKRQSLNSALSWHRGYQSGDYTKNNVLLGCLLDGFPEERDLVDPSGIIIMNIGGGREIADGTRTNKRARQKDQGHPKMLKAAFNAKALNQYIGVVVGESCTLMPSKVPHAYNALDWYFITDIWCEKGRNGYKFWKMRLEVTSPTNAVWWAPVDNPDPPRHQPGDVVTTSQECEICRMASKKIFSHAWVCLNYDCSGCFDLGGTEFSDLQYNEQFLNERTVYPGKITGSPDTGVEFPPSIVPAIPTLADGDTGTEEHMRQGFACPRCLGCSPRSHWYGWVCETPGCGFKLECTMKPIAITEMDNAAIRRKLATRKVEQHPAMVGMATQFQCGGYDVVVYPLLNLIDSCETKTVVGFLARLRPSAELLAAPNGPDDSFRDLHEHAAKDDWMRLPVRLKGGKQQMLTSHFAQNYGAQYKYVVSVGSKSFAEAPDPVLRALLQMRWAGHRVIEHAKMSAAQLQADSKVAVAPSLEFDFVEFNELLGLGYFEGNRINWHDDGEDTLGPTVATISFGAPSTMSFRPKIKVKGKPRRSNGSVLDLQLFHGDIVVMHGTEIHRCYEHRVISHGKRRFALTSRHIDLNKLDTDEERRTSKELGTLPERVKDSAFQPSEI